MPNFTYKAIATGGRTETGQLEAPDRRTALLRLQARQLRPLSVETVATAQAAKQVTPDEAAADLDFFASDRKTKLFGGTGKSVIGLEFCQRLLVLLQAGLPPGDAVRVLSQRTNDTALKNLYQQIWRDLSEGRSLAHALGQQGTFFAPATLHLIEAGEASGNLVPVLDRTVAYLDERRRMQSDMTARLAYPAFLICMALGVMLLLTFFLIPRMERMLTSLGGELPLITRFLLTTTDFATRWGWLVALIAVGAGFAVAAWRRTDAGRWKTDEIALRLPMLGRIALANTIYIVSHLLSTLLQSGVNTTEALRLVERVISNTVLRAKFAMARRQIQEGVSLATALDRVHFLPDQAMDILKVGENTGNVVTSLHDINRIFRDELNQRLRTLLVVTIGAAMGTAFTMVAVIAIAVVLSVLSVSNSVMQ